MPDGRKQEPGGWNRIVLEVVDLPARIAAMKKAGLRFRNEMETGPGGKQIQLEDPDANPVELFEPVRRPSHFPNASSGSNVSLPLGSYPSGPYDLRGSLHPQRLEEL